MKVTAKAPANIAFIKYWGKRNEKMRIPMNSSISMNLSEAFTTTSVDFRPELTADEVYINSKKAEGKEELRIIEHLDRIRGLAGIGLKAKVGSSNNFPKGSGIASSASGFAALTIAASKSAGLKLSEKELSILARVGSGSACRSIPDGFVEWKSGVKSRESYAYSLYPANHWDIYDVIAVVGETGKKVGSTEGHAVAESSPFYPQRIKDMPGKVNEIKKALKKKDFTRFGEIIEAEAINMHAVMMTSKPALYYWLPKSLEVMFSVISWRDRGVEVYFTIDAGPNIHIICEKKNLLRVKKEIAKIKGIKRVIVNKSAVGARVI